MIVTLLLGVMFLCLAMFYKPKWLFVGLSLIASGIYFEMPSGDLLIFIIYLLGILLLIIEFYVPDFGVIGILGFIAIVTALYMHLGDIGTLVLTILTMIVVITLSVAIPLRMGQNLTIGPGFVLETAAEKERGYSSQKDLSFLLNERGMTITALRPVGRAQINDEYYEVISVEDMITSGEPIYVSRVEGAKIYVRKGVNHESI